MKWPNRINWQSRYRFSVFISQLKLVMALPLMLSIAAQAQVDSAADPLFAQAWRDLQVLSSDAMQGRAPGSVGSQYARDYLAYRYQQLGLVPITSSFALPFGRPGRSDDKVLGVNLAGIRRGCQYPEQYLVITAHYDHLAMQGRRIFNGADDNASGVAGLLYLAGLSRQQCPAYSQVFLATDAEEQGLHGAEAFLTNAVLANQQILLNINLDMISRGERSQKLYLLSSRSIGGLRDWLASKPKRQRVRLQGVTEHQRLGAGRLAERVNWANASDHAPFRRAGIPYMYFGVGLHGQYHTEQDDWQRVSAEFYQSALWLIADGWRFVDKQPPELLRPALVNQAATTAAQTSVK